MVRHVLRREYRAERVILSGSGTQALQLALVNASRRVGEPSVVALPAFTCFDVGAAAVASGAGVMLYDVDPSTLGPDFDSLRRVLDDGARVVVVSPLYGLPVDWDCVEECVAPYDAIVIEDAAQGHGASWRGRPLGSLGDLGVLSFGRGKGWTGVRGGALLFRGRPVHGTTMRGRKPAVADELSVVLSAVTQWAMGRPTWYALPALIPWLELGETRYRDASPPEDMTRAAGALLVRSKRIAAEEAAVRRANAESLLKGIEFTRHVRAVSALPDGTPGYLRLPLRVSCGLAGLAAPKEAIRLGIAPSYPSTLAVLPQVRARMTRFDCRWPGGEELSRTLVTLPTHSQVTARERARVLQLLNRYSA